MTDTPVTSHRPGRPGPVDRRACAHDRRTARGVPLPTDRVRRRGDGGARRRPARARGRRQDGSQPVADGCAGVPGRRRRRTPGDGGIAVRVSREPRCLRAGRDRDDRGRPARPGRPPRPARCAQRRVPRGHEVRLVRGRTLDLGDERVPARSRRTPVPGVPGSWPSRLPTSIRSRAPMPAARARATRSGRSGNTHSPVSVASGSSSGMRDRTARRWR